MTHVVKIIKAKMNIFSVHLKRKRMLHFPSVHSVLKDNASASDTLDKVAEKYCQVINGFGQAFENRFCELDLLEPCVSFISNPFMNVDIRHCGATKCNVQLGCWTGGD